MMVFTARKLMLASLISSMVCATASAATFNVTKTADTNDGVCDADCSLREAVFAANASLGADTINLPSGDYKITISGANEDANATGDFDITEDLQINGSGSASTSISGEGAYKIFDVNGSASPISLSINNLTLKYAYVAAVDFSGTGTLTINDSVLTKNFNNGWGAAVEIRGGSTLEVNHSLFTENCASSGPAIDGEGTWMISNSTFSNHGGIFQSPFVASHDCQINSYGGGGTMYLQYSDVTITNSTFVNNEADGGGAILSYGGNLDIENSTFANNIANNSAGGWGNYGGGAIEYDNWSPPSSLTINNSTIVNNQAPVTSGGGIKVGNNVTVTVQNSIIANNTSPTGPDCVGAITSAGNTLLGNASGCNYTAGAGDLSGAPGLDAYTDNGAPGNGHYPLLSTSQAIDAGNNATCASSDQIGTTRPQDGDNDGTADCDIGAIEYEAPIPALDAVDDFDAVPLYTHKEINVKANDILGSGDVSIIYISPVSPSVGFAGLYNNGIGFFRTASGSATFTYTIKDNVTNQEDTAVVTVR